MKQRKMLQKIHRESTWCHRRKIAKKCNNYRKNYFIFKTKNIVNYEFWLLK